MQMVKKAIGFLLVILLSLAIFAPKRELYYLLEEQLMQEDIIINNEEIDSGLLTLKLRHPELYIKGIKVADVEEITLFTLLFYTSITAKGIKTDASLRRWTPVQISTISAHYQLLNPKNILMKTTGSFGEAEGYLSLSENLLHMDLNEGASVKSLRSFLKKGENGWYYETSF